MLCHPDDLLSKLVQIAQLQNTRERLAAIQFVKMERTNILFESLCEPWFVKQAVNAGILLHKLSVQKYKAEFNLLNVVKITDAKFDKIVGCMDCSVDGSFQLKDFSHLKSPWRSSKTIILSRNAAFRIKECFGRYYHQAYLSQ